MREAMAREADASRHRRRTTAYERAIYQRLSQVHRHQTAVHADNFMARWVLAINRVQLFSWRLQTSPEVCMRMNSAAIKTPDVVKVALFN